MSADIEVHRLRERVSEAERRLDQLFAHLGIVAPPLPGTTANAVSAEVRALIVANKIAQARAQYFREAEGAILSDELVACVLREAKAK